MALGSRDVDDERVAEVVHSENQRIVVGIRVILLQTVGDGRRGDLMGSSWVVYTAVALE